MTMYWQQIQVKTLTAPPGDPTEWVEESPGTDTTGGWLQPPNPVVWPVEYRYLLPWTGAAQIEPGDFVEPVQEETFPHWHTNYYPVQPVEYRYLLPWQAFLEEEAEFPADAEMPYWNFNRDPVQPVEYRYEIPAFFTWLDTQGIIEGLLVTLRPRTLMTTLQERTLETTLREGGRETV